MVAGDGGLTGPPLARLLGAWRSARPGYVALAAAIRLLVLDGRVPLRTRPPGERDLPAPRRGGRGGARHPRPRPRQPRRGARGASEEAARGQEVKRPDGPTAAPPPPRA